MNELRCPRHPKTKFAEAAGTDATIEVSCRPCRRDKIVDVAPLAARFDVIHVYDAAGKHLRTYTSLRT